MLGFIKITKPCLDAESHIVSIKTHLLKLKKAQLLHVNSQSCAGRLAF